MQSRIHARTNSTGIWAPARERRKGTRYLNNSLKKSFMAAKERLSAFSL
ncbi:MAG: hypothetical protein H6Q52_1623 [Deltaproteobacteria bacterium]|nr:hypothetical protein [Deltaproteobacteria bacterium]